MFSGEIIFSISDSKHLEVDFDMEILPSKIINKGDLVALGRKAPKNIWMYKIIYGNENEFIKCLDNIAVLLSNKAKYVTKLVEKYEEVAITVYMRSDFAEIGCSIPSNILKKLSLLECSLDFRILSFGMTIDD